MEKRTADDSVGAFRGRPSLLYPAVRTVDEGGGTLEGGFPVRLTSGLGTAKFLLGVCLAILGGMAVYVQAWSTWTYGGIWSGLFAIFTGLCVILVAKRQKPGKSLLVALVVLSVLGFLNTGLLATFTAMALVAEVYIEDVAGELVWKGVENTSPFAVQVFLLATATADSLLSLACCVITGREVCCCGGHQPIVVNTPRLGRDRLISWLGAHQPLPTVRLAHPPPGPGTDARKQQSKTPSTIRVPRGVDPAESVPSSASGSAKSSAPFARACREDERGTCRGSSPPSDEKYFALDKKLSEEFIERTWNR